MGRTNIRGRSPLALAGAAVLLLVGCAGSDTAEKPIESEFTGAPDWVVQGCNAYWGVDSSRTVCGVGSSGGSRNISLMRTLAIARGRTEIARSLHTQVQAMLKDYQSTTTGGRDYGFSADDEQYVIDVSKQITDMSLSGTEMVDSWSSPNDTFYALVALDLDKFEDTVDRMDQLSEQVRRAVVDRAEEAFAELDEAIERERERP